MGSMGADAADMDNDLIPDLIVTEMLPETLSRQKNKQVYESYDKFSLAGSKGYHKQYPRNAVQRNLGNTFYEVSRQLGLSATEWSWAALLFDMDNDGYKNVEYTDVDDMGKDKVDDMDKGKVDNMKDDNADHLGG